MFEQILDCIFCFLSGIFFNMSFLHLFAFFETRNHPMIAKSRRPYLASKIWGVVQLTAGSILLILVKFHPGYNLGTAFLAAGFCFWAIVLGVITRRYDAA